jgi:hypothetical protein
MVRKLNERRKQINARKAMLAKRAERAKRWLYTEDKPKENLHPIALQDFRNKWLFK